MDPDNICLLNVALKVESSGNHNNRQLDPVLHTLSQTHTHSISSVYINPSTQQPQFHSLNRNTQTSLKYSSS